MLLVQFIDMSGIEQARDNRALKSLFHFHNDQVWKSLLSETVDHKTGPVVDDREKKISFRHKRAHSSQSGIENV